MDPLEIWKQCGGWYECPKDHEGKRLGPLVGYTAIYKDEEGREKNYVGDTYCNFAEVEQYPWCLIFFAGELAKRIRKIVKNKIDVFVGVPQGGLFLASALARILWCRGIYLEKGIAPFSSPRERFILGRHEVHPYERVVIIEDVCNNFFSTSHIVKLITEAKGNIVAIACVLNRSSTRNSVSIIEEIGVPVISVLQIPLSEYKQEDPEVAEDIAKGNIIWHPKKFWPYLNTVMAKS